MQAKLIELNRKKICPILWKHEWDYSNNTPDADFFQFCIREMMRWQYRKGRGISYGVLSSLVSRYAAEKDIDNLEVSKIQLALKSFTNSGLYSKINQLVTDAEIQVGVGGGHVIMDTLSAVGQVDEETCILSWSDSIRSREDFKQSYQTRLASVWSFYSLNRYPVFYNLYLDEENKIKHVKYRPNQFYIRDSRDFLIGMKDLIEDQAVYPAHLELCKSCYRRNECQTTKTRTKNSQKSW